MEHATELVDRWVAGWAISRSAIREQFDRGWRVEVEAETRSLEYVIACPSPKELGQFVAQAAGRPDVWLTIVGEIGDDLREALSILEPLTHAEQMMTLSIAPVAMPDLIILEDDGAVARVRIEREGETAARGQAAVRGSDVVFDRIGTVPQFQRRGLGSLIVAGLTSWAADCHAQTGLLMASTDGQQLYRSLGWNEVSPIVTFHGRSS
jgi:GNAT superfamily N-acetyltransferase